MNYVQDIIVLLPVVRDNIFKLNIKKEVAFEIKFMILFGHFLVKINFLSNVATMTCLNKLQHKYL